jgi:ribonuclease BN (tRNA processing enzyme)
MKTDGHLTPSYAGRMARLANIKKLVLTHFYPACDSMEITEQCRRAYAGPLILAEDLLTIQLD